MKTTISRAWVTAAILTSLMLGVTTAPLMAHHSFAMYDTAPEANKTMTGKLVRFVIGANHSQYIMDIVKPDGSPELDKEGKAVSWTVETTSATQLVRQNITVESFKIGTIFTITFSPLRDGRRGGAQTPGVSSLIMCGMKMPAGGCNETTGKKY